MRTLRKTLTGEGGEKEEEEEERGPQTDGRSGTAGLRLWDGPIYYYTSYTGVKDRQMEDQKGQDVNLTMDDSAFLVDNLPTSLVWLPRPCSQRAGFDPWRSCLCLQCSSTATALGIPEGGRKKEEARPGPLGMPSRMYTPWPVARSK